MYSSDAENSRSACFDSHNFIRTGIKYKILLFILSFGLALFFKFPDFDLLVQKDFSIFGILCQVFCYVLYDVIVRCTV